MYATFCYTGSNVSKGKVGYTLPIVCSDTGTGPIKVDGKTVGYNNRLTDSKFVFVEVVDVNEQPSIENEIFSVPENSPPGSFVGRPSAQDEDINDVLTYALSGTTLFSIKSGVGNVTVAGTLNFEQTPTITMTITVTDAGGSVIDATITVNLINVNEAPVFATPSSNMNLDENAIDGFVIGSITAADDDVEDYLHFVVSGGNDFGAFGTISTSNRGAKIIVTNSTSIDFERKQTYNIQLTVRDRVPEDSDYSDMLSATIGVTIRVNDIDDVSISNVQVLTGTGTIRPMV